MTLPETPLWYRWSTSKEIANLGQPCTHALVIGVSRYPHLKHAAERPLHAFDLKPLQASAKAAWRFAKWLKSERGFSCPDYPLASVRLLLSPTEDEKATRHGMSDANVKAATADNVRSALQAWADSFTEENSQLIFMFVGHGVQDEEGDCIALLEDFAKDAKLLRGSLNINKLMLGMQNVAARRQLYFVDSCRTIIDEQDLREAGYVDRYGRPQLALLGSGVETPTIRYAKRDERAQILQMFSTRPTEPAHELRNHACTVFSKALLRSLRRCAAQKREGHWEVMPDALCSQARIWTAEIAAKALGKRQEAHGDSRDFDITKAFNQLVRPPRSWLSVTAKKNFADLKLLRIDDGHETLAVQRNVNAATARCIVEPAMYKVLTYDAAQNEISHRYKSLKPTSFGEQVEL